MRRSFGGGARSGAALKRVNTVYIEVESKFCTLCPHEDQVHGGRALEKGLGKKLISLNCNRQNRHC